jgi:hypothetical protein
MKLKNIHYLCFLVAIVFLFGIGQTVLAEPAPPKLVVNHDTKECAEIFGGDECMDCFPPEGWEILGWSYQAECPQGYTFTEVEENCIPFKDEFCCTEGHSGVAGDCADMVINKRNFQCAFVDDVNACNLPEPWLAKPEGMAVGNWTCPSRYQWVDDLDCQSGSTQPDQSESNSEGPPLVCGGSTLGILLIPALGLAFHHQKHAR